MNLNQRIEAANLDRLASDLGMTAEALAAWDARQPYRVDLAAEKLVQDELAWRRFRAQIVGPVRG